LSVYGSFLPPNRVRGKLPAGVAAPNSECIITYFGRFYNGNPIK